MSSKIAVPSAEWVDYFHRNQLALLDMPWDEGSPLASTDRQAIESSIQEFQLGESGEGTHFFRCARKYIERTGDEMYLEALRLFIAEENRHARDLGRFMDSQGIERIRHSWVDGFFRFLRHRAGLELSIAVLVTAEIIAEIYYRALRNATPSPVLRRICEQILRDEVQHVRFQCERLAILRRRRPKPMLQLTTALHKLLFAGACVVVWRNHGRAMRAGGYTFRAFCRNARRRFDRAVILMTPASYAWPEAIPGSDSPSSDSAIPFPAGPRAF